MIKKQFYYNKTFCIGADVHLNACVGENGGQDHIKYGFGYDEAVELMIKAAEEDNVTVDAIIYPLVFCARHRIELFLKDHLLKFTEIRHNDTITESLLSNTHDLSTLWNLFKEYGAKTDRRILPFLKKAQPYITDFAKIDPTGETFRYPYDKLKSIHLKHTPIININTFAKSYFKISKLIKELEHLTEYLQDEYSQNTFTDKLSRDDIYNISVSLPPKEEWSHASFDQIRLKIRAKYGLSSNDLSKTINIIKTHREFSSNINIELPLDQLNIKDFKTYILIYNKFNPDNDGSLKLNYDSLLKHVQTKESSIKQIISKLPKEAIICIYTLIELGRPGYYGESFDLLYNKFKQSVDNGYNLLEYCSYILNNTMALQYIRNALFKTGQSTILKKCFQVG